MTLEEIPFKVKVTGKSNPFKILCNLAQQHSCEYMCGAPRGRIEKNVLHSMNKNVKKTKQRECYKHENVLV